MDSVINLARLIVMSTLAAFVIALLMGVAVFVANFPHFGFPLAFLALEQ